MVKYELFLSNDASGIRIKYLQCIPQVLQLTATACDKAKQMADETHKTSEVVGGVEGAKLEVKNLALCDAAQMFKTTAQVKRFYELLLQRAVNSYATAKHGSV